MEVAIMAKSNGAEGPRVRELGHVALFVRDMVKMRDWYRDMLGLTVTDGDPERIIFLSSRPDEGHHERALAKGRETDDSVAMVQQLSWHVGSVDELLAFHKRFKERGVHIQSEVTHGNALSIYFYDPEGNRNEVYFTVKAKVKQPFRKDLNLEQSSEQVLAENQRLIEEDAKSSSPVATR